MVLILEAMLAYPKVVCHRRSKTSQSQGNLDPLLKTYCDHTIFPRPIEAQLVQRGNMEIRGQKQATMEAEARQVAANHTFKATTAIKQETETATNCQARSSTSKTTVAPSSLLQAEAAWRSKSVPTVLPQVTQ